MQRIDLTGQTFGRLTVLEYSYTDKSFRVHWKCQCSCENKTIKIIDGANLIKQDRLPNGDQARKNREK